MKIQDFDLWWLWNHFLYVLYGAVIQIGKKNTVVRSHFQELQSITFFYLDQVAIIRSGLSFNILENSAEKVTFSVSTCFSFFVCIKPFDVFCHSNVDNAPDIGGPRKCDRGLKKSWKIFTKFWEKCVSSITCFASFLYWSLPNKCRLLRIIDGVW